MVVQLSSRRADGVFCGLAARISRQTRFGTAELGTPADIDLAVPGRAPGHRRRHVAGLGSDVVPRRRAVEVRLLGQRDDAPQRLDGRGAAERASAGDV
ncbi:hypothetical protein GCM10009609_37630 [Pseudonocardia aurantiaca]|uniref:Uncharacterized protein n=1 Tax=Pseudonocardia aurantiaca TaxID=75290 RepID=A0ABW4FNV9_9PSEU